MRRLIFLLLLFVTSPVWAGIDNPTDTSSLMLTASADTTYLKLDASNDPITGALTISNKVSIDSSLAISGDAQLYGSVSSPYYKITTTPTMNSTGTISIIAKDASLLTPNAGWMPIKSSDGTTVYFPYWQ